MHLGVFYLVAWSVCRTIKVTKKTGFWGPKNRARGPPGRGVLRFSRPAYRRPVHFSAKIVIFTKNLQI